MDLPNPTKTSEVAIKFLENSQVNSEMKNAYCRLVKNPIIKELLKRTPINSLFEVFREYMKYADLYDDIFCGRIRFFSRGIMNDALPFFNHRKIDEGTTLEKLIGPETLNGQVVETFVACDYLHHEIRRIMVKLQNNKMLTTAFNSKNSIVSIFVEPLANGQKKLFVNFLKAFSGQRIDLIRLRY